MWHTCQAYVASAHSVGWEGWSLVPRARERHLYIDVWDADAGPDNNKRSRTLWRRWCDLSRCRHSRQDATSCLVCVRWELLNGSGTEGEGLLHTSLLINNVPWYYVLRGSLLCSQTPTSAIFRAIGSSLCRVGSLSVEGYGGLCR